MFTMSSANTGRMKRFLKIKRAMISLCILLSLYCISLCAEVVANDKPLLIRYNGKLFFFPVYIFYPGTAFGGDYDTEARYTELAKTHGFKQNKDNFILFPPVPYSPYTADLTELSGLPPHSPDLSHFLGTDDKGRDVFARLLYGFRVYMSLAIILLILEIIIGMSIGILRGYGGRIIDVIGGRFIDILSVLPFLYIVILIGDVIGRGFVTLIVVISIFNWIGLSCHMRAELFRMRKNSFIDAAKILGTGHIKIIFCEILPNTFSSIITFAPFSLIASIKLLFGLDYLGFGLPASSPGWGELMNQGMEHLSSYWLSVFPFLILLITLLLLAFVGQGIREAVDPVQAVNSDEF
ncbi:MAG: ABC transporter permease subunit [Spirochaetales bacterium]|nr:ABC transporter permease subunit [Spirochaetales bacterium]